MSSGFLSNYLWSHLIFPTVVGFCSAGRARRRKMGASVFGGTVVNDGRPGRNSAWNFLLVTKGCSGGLCPSKIEAHSGGLRPPLQFAAQKPGFVSKPAHLSPFSLVQNR